MQGSARTVGRRGGAEVEFLRRVESPKIDGRVWRRPEVVDHSTEKKAEGECYVTENLLERERREPVDVGKRKEGRREFSMDPSMACVPGDWSLVGKICFC